MTLVLSIYDFFMTNFCYFLAIKTLKNIFKLLQNVFMNHFGNPIRSPKGFSINLHPYILDDLGSTMVWFQFFL